MNKDFLPYDLSLSIRELGFDESCFAVYSEYDKTRVYEHSSIKEGKIILAPLYQQAFYWFEKKHSLYVEKQIDTNVNEILDIRYIIKSWKFPPIEIIFETPYDCFSTEKANIACLKKMIEIIKKEKL